MALTNVYYSPSGAGSQDGSSAANAKAAITGTSWTSTIIADKTKHSLDFSCRNLHCKPRVGSNIHRPHRRLPHFWVGADARRNNLLEPKWSDDSSTS